jgi:hypothetical protein
MYLQNNQRSIKSLKHIQIMFLMLFEYRNTVFGIAQEMKWIEGKLHD